MRERIGCAGAVAAGAVVVACGCAQLRGSDWNDPLYLRVTASADEGNASGSVAVPEVRDAPEWVDTSSQGQLTVEDAVLVGVSNHPRMREAGFVVRAAADRQRQAGIAPNPNVVLEMEALGSEYGRGGETTLLLEQEIPSAGKRRKAQAVAEADRFAEQAAFRAAAYDVATRIRVAFVAAQAADARLAEYESLVGLADELLAAAEARIDAGAATEPDRLRAQVVREQAGLDAATARAACDAARRALGAAMGVERAFEGSLAGDLAAAPRLPERERAIALALEHNAEVEGAQARIDRAARAHALAKAMGAPDVFAAAGPRYSDLDNETTLDVGVGVEIPIFDRNQGEIAAHVAERISAGAALGAVRLRLIEAVSAEWLTYETARGAVDAYGASLLPKAEQTLALTREAYRVGKTDYLRMLDAQQTLVRSRIAYIDAVESLQTAAATLDGLLQINQPWNSIPDSGAPEVIQ